MAPPTRCQGKWLVSDDLGNELSRYDVVIVSAPGPQAGELLQGSPHLARRASSVRIARNSSKPGRKPDVETWILHASADWTQCHLEEPSEAIQERLLDAFWDVTGVGG